MRGLWESRGELRRNSNPKLLIYLLLEITDTHETSASTRTRSGALERIPNNKTMIDGQPGPLDYQIPTLIDEGPKYFMGAKTVYNRNPLLTGTGPGDYNPEKPTKKLSYSISGRSKDPTDLQMPGPGHYEDPKTKFIPGAGLGKSPRCKSKFSLSLSWFFRATSRFLHNDNE